MLNPCLLCGSENVKIQKFGYNAIIKCANCGNSRGGFSSRETLISIWNKENNCENTLNR